MGLQQSAASGEWLGPYESDFGLHVVRVVDRKPPRQPPFEEIEAQVREVYAELRRREANENAYAEMRARYEVVVETGEEEAALP
jgi:parvulin-like peptidyl-prolyl isomerase